jgi:hypothetical protein
MFVISDLHDREGPDGLEAELDPPISLHSHERALADDVIERNRSEGGILRRLW